MIVSRAYEERRLKLLAELVVGDSVLDVGYAQHPNPYFANVRRTGLDLQPSREQAAVRYEEEIVGDVSRVRELCAGRRFDTIVCAELIEHVENPYALLRDLREVLADAGRLLVSTPNPLAFPVVLAELLRSKRYFYTREHSYYFLPRWVARLFESTGYRVELTRGVGLWTPLPVVPPAPIALSYQVIYVGRKS